MIPGPLFSLPMLLLLLAPFFAAALSVGLLLHGLRWYFKARHRQRKFWTWPVISLAVLAVAGDLWGGVLSYQAIQSQARFELQAHYRASRQRFVLPQDFQYGEFTFPQGSLIQRYEPWDNGEPQRPLGLRGLDTARFAQPVQIAGAWANAIDTHGQLELARDQRLSPVYVFDAQAEQGYGAWVIAPHHPGLACLKGDMAHYHAPMIDYDIQAEFVQGPPDGAAARFRPSEWGFTRCESGQPPIDVPPPYQAAGPTNAQPKVWGPLLPAPED
jgi:hypothetical protein